ncbi:unnamed protein product [Lampetra planeri]
MRARGAAWATAVGGSSTTEPNPEAAVIGGESRWMGRTGQAHGDEHASASCSRYEGRGLAPRGRMRLTHKVSHDTGGRAAAAAAAASPLRFWASAQTSPAAVSRVVTF